jgi:hypothetical protein
VKKTLDPKPILTGKGTFHNSELAVEAVRTGYQAQSNSLLIPGHTEFHHLPSSQINFPTGNLPQNQVH